MKHLFLALAIGLTAMGCSRYGQIENEKASCGCNSPILKSELNGREFSGYLYYSQDKKYKITTPNKARPLAYQNTICNDEILPTELRNIEQDKFFEVTYKANFKKDCIEAVPMIDWEYYYIELTEIKLKN